MNAHRLEELLSEFVRWLDYIEFKVQNTNSVAFARHQSLEQYWLNT